MRAVKVFLIFALLAVTSLNVMTASGVTSTTNSVIAAKGKGGNFSMMLPPDLSDKQSKILQMAYDIAKSDGHKNPEVLQGIVFQESKAGGMKMFRVAGQNLGLKTNERYYGITQIKLVAAKDVLKSYPALKEEWLQTDTDEEIIANLITNDRFNLQVASKYLMLMPNNWSTDKKIAAYNQGPTGVASVNESTFKYVTEVKRHIRDTVPQLAMK